MGKSSKEPLHNNGPKAGSEEHQRKPTVLWLVLFLVILVAVYLVYNRINDNREDNRSVQTEASGTGQDPDFAEITAKLLNKSQEFKKATPESQVALEKELVDLAMLRRDLMTDALAKHPKSVSRAAIPPGLAKQQPSEISRFIEEQSTVEGVMEVSMTDYDDKDSGKNPLEYTITDSKSKKKYQIHTQETLNKVTTGSKVKVSGVVLDSNIVPLDESSIVVTSQVTTAAATQKKVAVILINFQSDTTTYETQDTARAKMFADPDSVNKFYQESSYGQIELVGHLRQDGDVFGYYTVPYNNDNCDDYQLWSNSAQTIAAADGFNYNNYNTILYLFADRGFCAWSGRATVGGMPGRAWIATDSLNKYVASHEFGHTLGMLHASNLKCTDSAGAVVAISDTCIRNEYGDPLDVMGASLQSHSNNHFKGLLTPYASTNWIPMANVFTVPSGQNGTYTLVPIEQPLTGIQTLRIPKNYSIVSGNAPTPGYYYLEYRQPIGFDTYPNYPGMLNGVFVRLARGFSESDYSNILDATPETPSNFRDGAITPGRTFTDPEAGITITTNSISPAGAVVSITSTPMPCSRRNPSLVTRRWRRLRRASTLKRR